MLLKRKLRGVDLHKDQPFWHGRVKLFFCQDSEGDTFVFKGSNTTGCMQGWVCHDGCVVLKLLYSWIVMCCTTAGHISTDWTTAAAEIWTSEPHHSRAEQLQLQLDVVRDQICKMNNEHQKKHVVKWHTTSPYHSICVFLNWWLYETIQDCMYARDTCNLNTRSQ